MMASTLRDSRAPAGRATAWAAPIVALALAGCGGGIPRPASVPPDPPPIPVPKPAVPAAALSKIAPPSPAVTAARATPGRGADRPMPFAYLVQPGDTVYGISRKLSVPLREVIDANALSPPYTLSVSQTLRIPNPRRHTVRRGDTVYGISRAYGVEMSELVRLNGVEPPYTISPGVRLVVPAAVKGKAGPQSPGKLAPPAKTAPRAVQRAAVPAPAAKALQASTVKSVPARTAKAVPAAKPARLAKIPQPPPRAGSKFLWPAKGKLLATYGPKKGGLHNDGINIAAPRGAPVRAAENGVVVYSGNELRGFGNLILIKHANGWVTAYAHTQDIRVGRGQQVKRGQTIAKVGSSGNVSRPQLHFEIRKGSRAVDPKRFLGKKSA